MEVSRALVRSAIESDSLIPVFQPVVDIRTGEIRGLEVLARWNHPEHGPILPENFIALAEQERVIDRLTSQIMRKALLAAAKFNSGFGLSFNISPVELHDRTLPARLRRAFDGSPVPIDQITIEITESAIIDNLDSARRIIGQLKDMGLRMALDDFGTGYSSLRHLEALPFDELKVDQSFVERMMTRRECRKIVRAVVELGRTLGMLTVAEGVETEAQCETLHRLGCDAGQGWIYGKPMTATAVAKFLQCSRRVACKQTAQRRSNGDSPFLLAFPLDTAAHLRALYEAAPVGLCLLDTQLRYIHINNYLAEINGFPVQAHLGKTPREMAPDLFPWVEPHIQAALRGEHTSGLKLRRTGLKSGIDRDLLVSYAPVYDEAAEVIGLSVTVLDLSAAAAGRTAEALAVA